MSFFSKIYEEYPDLELYDVYLQLINKYNNTSKILELGSGTGNLTTLLCEHYAVIATDLYEDNLEYLTKKLGNNISIYKQDITKEISHKNGMVVMCSDVINYLNENDMITAFSQIHRMLDKNYMIFDGLRKDYFDTLNDYEEEIIIDDVIYKWNIQVSLHLLEHTFTSHRNTYTLTQSIYTKEQYITYLEEFFKIVEIIEYEDRFIFIVSKK